MLKAKDVPCEPLSGPLVPLFLLFSSLLDNHTKLKNVYIVSRNISVKEANFGGCWL